MDENEKIKGNEVTEINPPLNLMPGTNFSKRYKIIEEIGKGGMGKVYKAWDQELNITVALKIIQPDISHKEEVVKRFKRELLIAREINHDNVIRIHDLGEIDGVKYISMNYIEGFNLRDFMKASGKLSIKKVLDITKQVCNALSAAHKKGIIHRDLKPQNIMIDKKGKVYVLDFGMARSLRHENITLMGEIVGTPGYMSLEQIKGENLDRRSDIFSLGIILYEMVTGKLPFTGKTLGDLLLKYIKEKPQIPSEIDANVPKYLERIIFKCMNKDPKNRYSNVEEILKELEKREKKAKTIPIENKGERQKKRKLSFGIKISIGITSLCILVFMFFLIFNFIHPKKKETKADEVTLHDIKNPGAEFKVDLFLDRENATYIKGEEIKIFFKSTKDCYLILLNLGPSGKVSILYPNLFQKDISIKAGVTYSIPGQDANYMLQARGPAGKEVIKVLATRNKEKIINKGYLIPPTKEKPFVELKVSEEKLVKDIVKALKKVNKKKWAEAEKEIKILENVKEK
jgi:serine/threonine protein kinase